jgi:hypothetical protein
LALAADPATGSTTWGWARATALVLVADEFLARTRDVDERDELVPQPARPSASVNKTIQRARIAPR